MAENAAKIPVFYNNKRLKNVKDVSCAVAPGVTVVYTEEGLALYDDGEGNTSIQVTLAIASGGPEVEAWKNSAKREFVPMQFGVGASRYAAVGKITEGPTFSKSVGQESSMQFTWTGPLDAPQG